mmetsp:Transcript_24087/g.54746  ORF Transcript_24087/g.54746 Transcript_24087/m.54746 type:complete len:94 (+) Transcript_24087:770-1051(+)
MFMTKFDRLVLDVFVSSTMSTMLFSSVCVNISSVSLLRAVSLGVDTNALFNSLLLLQFPSQCCGREVHKWPFNYFEGTHHFKGPSHHLFFCNI